MYDIGWCCQPHRMGHSTLIKRWISVRENNACPLANASCILSWASGKLAWASEILYRKYNEHLFSGECSGKFSFPHWDMMMNVRKVLHIYPGNTGTLFPLLMCSLCCVQMIRYILASRSYSFVCTLHYLIIIIMQTYLKALNF